MAVPPDLAAMMERTMGGLKTWRISAGFPEINIDIISKWIS